eukprot:6379617-Alexandrium_andersonii.AAC.1
MCVRRKFGARPLGNPVHRRTFSPVRSWLESLEAGGHRILFGAMPARLPARPGPGPAKARPSPRGHQGHSRPWATVTD